MMTGESSHKFVGFGWWAAVAQTERVSIDRAILRSENELVIGFVYDGCSYTTTLTRTDGNEFQGKYTRQDGGRLYEGNTSCRFFPLPDGAFLFGRWAEDGDDYFWWADRNSVEHFPDEG